MLTPIYSQTSKPYTTQPIEHLPVSFGSTNRTYQMHSDNFVSCYTCMFRGDLNFPQFIKTLESNFIHTNKVNIINAACSDGSEAYSLIIYMKENLNEEQCHKYLPLKAYDYDEKIIKAAKSGKLLISNPDLNKLKKYTNDENIYFNTNYEGNLKIENDATYSQKKTIKARKTLTNNVEFEQKNIFDILENLEDDSNTVLMFRNALGHLLPNEHKKFVELTSEKLKPGSLVVIGSFDKQDTNIGNLLTANGFTEIMENVYRKNGKVKTQNIFQRFLNLFS